MFIGPLPGGSPGPDAVASGRMLLGVTVFSVVASGALLWFLLYAARVVEESPPTLPAGW